MSDSHESRQGEFRATTIAMTALAAVFVVLRCLSRVKFRGKSLGVDDYAMMLSLFLLFALAGLDLTLIQYGMGLHASTLPTKSLVIIAQLSMAYECVYSLTIGAIKMSILLMYTRVFIGGEFRVAAITLGAVIMTWIVGVISMSVLECAPIQRAWDASLPGTCDDANALFFANSIPNIVTDLVILILPVRAVWKMETTTTHRLSVIAILLLGCFVIFTSAYRFAADFTFKATDIPWTLGDSCTWSIIECSCGIISACMPTLYPLLGIIQSKLPGGGSYGHMTDVKISGRAESTVPPFRPQNELVGKAKVQLVVTQPQDELGDEVPLNTIVILLSMPLSSTGMTSIFDP
ncbi:hypothetical protein N7454_007186 [Penicillium verhagenii]|nr:hypothetical protein N7454_007186 [Penicillium verhagenii]